MLLGRLCIRLIDDDYTWADFISSKKKLASTLTPPVSDEGENE